ncbi:hypothetical protein [Maribacter sp. HTCC2170]|uniref:hypothetical protein n=1 Tax=Maribacter sp. (strain HTCC2170 / KCCM 42371) TaxID=313603 RepID=UPI00006B4761|nr:hypothetical protein [Maribacter sp. HTCC2170]EAR01946.1 hypothetical protein FB2170_15498 [Maribacter sp. HTCC2170]
MTDELELLKKDWQKKEAHLPKLSYDEIHNMIWKKSSSIVKWILIISILEFTLPHLLLLIPSYRENMDIYDKLGLHNILIGLSVITYGVALYFIIQFYRRYKEISVLDNSKNLMRKILKTRATVKHYIIYSLSMILVIVALMIVGVYLTDDIYSSFSELREKSEHISPEKIKVTIMIAMAIMGVLMTAIVGGIYFLLYGLLLRKLKRNYNDLKQLEI